PATPADSAGEENGQTVEASNLEAASAQTDAENAAPVIDSMTIADSTSAGKTMGSSPAALFSAISLAQTLANRMAAGKSTKAVQSTVKTENSPIDLTGSWTAKPEQGV